VSAFRLQDAVIQALTPAVLANLAEPDLVPYREPMPESTSVDLDVVRGLCRHAVALELPPLEGLDSWVAPRLHAAVRVSRRVASDPGFWSWIALAAGREYVFYRHHRESKEDRVHPWRYTGDLTRNALARLWWGAEMARNGPDYALAAALFRRVRTAQFAMELAYSRYRPAVIAFVRVCEGFTSSGRMSDAQMTGLSTKLNAYLTLQPIEAVGLRESLDPRYDERWRGEPVGLHDVTVEGLDDLHGPEDGYADPSVVAALEGWFETLIPPRTGRSAA
jgi:hypothetical protein